MAPRRLGALDGLVVKQLSPERGAQLIVAGLLVLLAVLVVVLVRA